MLAILSTFVVVFAAFGSSQAVLADDYQNNERLNGENQTDFMLYWTYNKADSTIAFAAKAKTENWVGLGFMTKIDNTTTYDVVRGAYDDFSNSSEIFDFHAVGTEAPVLDTQQNLMNASVAENNNYTTIMFTRKLDTGDANDTVITPGQMIIAWSIGRHIDHVRSRYIELGYTTITFIQEDQKNDTMTMTTTMMTCLVNEAVVCKKSCLLLAATSLFLLLLLRL